MRLMLMSGLLWTLAACDNGATDDTAEVDNDIIDEDGDGFSASVDCDDDDAKINPEATEICDEVDNNCDGDIDGGTGLTVFQDVDEDGYGDRPSPAINCDVPFGFAAEGNDCNDNNEAIFPGADELCNNFDDDCDGATDEEAVDAGSWYEDADGDGFGDDSTEQRGCDVPAGFAYEGGDCDEGEPLINPGMPESCNDGIDDDCDPTTTENGVVSFYSYTEDKVYDLTQVFQSGSTLFPARYVNTMPGEMTFCGGKWYGAIETFADLDIKGIGGSRFNELDANHRFPTLVIDETEPLNVTVTGITLRRGDAQKNGQDGYRRSGGNLFCKDAASLLVNDVVITDGRAESGGGMYIQNCPTEIYDTEFSLNNGVYGGALNVYGSEEVYIQDSEFFENSVLYYGGGMHVTTRGGDVAVDLVDTLFYDNEASYYGAALYLYQYWSGGNEFHITCTDTDPEDGIRSGFIRNTSTYAWANYGAIYAYAYYYYGESTFESVGCDFGVEESDDDNNPSDLYWYAQWPAQTYNYDDNVTFMCEGQTCQ